MDRGRKWAYRLDCWDDRTGSWDRFDTREEAIAAGIEAAREDGRPSTVCVGEIELYEPRVRARPVLDYLIDDVESSDWGDCSEIWLMDVTGKEEDMLEMMLTDAFNAWARLTFNEPTDFYRCPFDEEVEVPDGN